MSDAKEQEQIAYFKTRITEMLKRVPASVNAGTYQTAVEYKKLAVSAMRNVASGRVKLSVLNNIHNQLAGYGQ